MAGIVATANPIGVPPSPRSSPPSGEAHAGSANQTDGLQRQGSTVATKKDEAMLRAADLTARQLQQAPEIVEGKLGAERAQ